MLLSQKHLVVYVCVYKTDRNYLHNLKNFYSSKTGQVFEPNTFVLDLIDTSDDPAFLGHSVYKTEGGKLSWGICRPDVRNAISHLNLEEIDCKVIFIAYDGKDYFLKAICTVENNHSMYDIVRNSIQPYCNYANLLIRYDSGNKYQSEEYFHTLSSATGDEHRDWYERIGLFDWKAINPNGIVKGQRTIHRKQFDNAVQYRSAFMFPNLRQSWNYKPASNYIIFSEGSIISSHGIKIASIKQNDFEVWQLNSPIAQKLHSTCFYSPEDNETKKREHLRTVRLGSGGGYPHRHIRLDSNNQPSLAQEIDELSNCMKHGM